MKANEFVKKFGWEEAEEIVGGLPEKFKFKPLGSVCWDNNTYKYSDRFKPRSSLGSVCWDNNTYKYSDRFKPRSSLGSVCWDNNTYKYSDRFKPRSSLVNMADLKCLVESHELVAIHGFEESKEIVDNAPSDDHFYSWTLGGSGVRDKTVNIGELRKAIADVESCMEGGK